jgi:choline dehydrogenase-like flavoprotein
VIVAPVIVAPVIVVGAGTAGCAVASVLGRQGIRVLLLEAGSERNPDAIGDEPTMSPDLFVAQTSGRAMQTYVVSDSAEHRNRPYLRGRGVGGSGAINGLVCQPGFPDDYNAWEKVHGCAGWSWTEVAPLFEELRSNLHVTMAKSWGNVDRAIVARYGLRHADIWQDIGTTRAYLAIDQLGRRDVDSSVHKTGNVEIRTNATVQSLLLHDESKTVKGVRLTDGTELESTHTIICAGVFESPLLLLRSRIGGPAVGTNLHDHMGISIDLVIDDATPLVDERLPFGTPVTSVVHHTSDHIQLIPINRLGVSSELRNRGAIMASPLQATHGRGRVSLVDGAAKISFNRSDDQDRTWLRHAARFLAETITSFVADVRPLDHDDATAPLRLDDTELDRWILDHEGSYFHAAGTCLMGPSNSAEAVVDPQCAVIGWSGVSVIDASIFPSLPLAGPYLPTIAVATLAAQRFADRFGAEHRSGEHPSS